MLWKCCTQYASKSGKLSSGHRTGKGQFSFQSQRKVMPQMFKLPHKCTHITCKQSNAQFSKQGFNSMWTIKFQMFKLDLPKAEKPEIKLPTSVGSQKKQKSSRKTSTSALLITPKPLTVWITTNCGKLLEMGIPDHPTYHLKICMQVKKQQLEPDMKQQTGSK